MNSVKRKMTDELRELLEDIQTVYEGKGMVVHPNSFDKLRMEVIKLDNINKQQNEQIEKMKCLDEEIIKALKESEDCAWLPCHNGKAKYLYLQSAIDIVRDKFEEIKEK